MVLSRAGASAAAAFSSSATSTDLAGAVVVLAVDDPEEETSNEASNTEANIHPKELRVNSALVKRKSDMMKDFMLAGALVNAYSRPVILAKISERPIRR
ncbi:hypothetical protein KCU81_g105, partial [Aureobasidium melanogenum]